MAYTFISMPDLWLGQARQLSFKLLGLHCTVYKKNIENASDILYLFI